MAEAPQPVEARRPEEFRNYAAEARDTVKEFYRLNHTHQTLDFVLAKKEQYLSLDRMEMTVWEALEYLEQLVDDSDPDVDFTQIEHAVQTAEAVRAAGQPRWFQLTGLVHDLGKILCIWGEPQWAVVGDTFPVGCRFSEKCIYHEFFASNPDASHPVYATEHGIYQPHCGLDHVHISWGHDEYVYHVFKNHLPKEGLYALRYHSLYPWHKEGAYAHLANEDDREALKWVKAFNRFDLYSKGDARPNVKELTPYYKDLIDEFVPGKFRW
jgi:inositol oxygenase